MDCRKPELARRYHNDPIFHQCVSMMRNLIEAHGVSPGEMREALFLATYEYEMTNPIAITRRFERMREMLESFQPVTAHDKGQGE